MEDSMFGTGELNTAFAKVFIGDSFLNPLGDPAYGIFNVTFSPGCRNNWHIHNAGGQLLLCTDGVGWYQEWGQPARELHPGDVVDIKPGVKHWHGAAADGMFAHIAMNTATDSPLPGQPNEWCEAVDDAAYAALPAFTVPAH